MHYQQQDKIISFWKHTCFIQRFWNQSQRAAELVPLDTEFSVTAFFLMVDTASRIV